MAGKATRYLPLGFAALFVICAALACCFMFQAGCVGDLKGGAQGDPVRALALENAGMLAMVLSAISGGVAIGLVSRPGHRVAHALACALLALICLWFAGVRLESWGMHSSLAMVPCVPITLQLAADNRTNVPCPNTSTAP